MLLCETLPVGPFQCNCTVLACDDSKEAVIIDPGGDVPKINEIIEHYDLTVKAIIHTHAHIDHIHCTRDVKETCGGEIVLHRDDLPLYTGIAAQAAMFGWQVRSTLPVDRFVVEGDTVQFGVNKAVVLHTPGHTPGSICFEVRDNNDTIVFAGDTLFRRSIGRTDLPGGHGPTLLQSISEKLYTLPPESLVIPGHGPNTTIEEEAAANPFVRKKL